MASEVSNFLFDEMTTLLEEQRKWCKMDLKSILSESFTKKWAYCEEKTIKLSFLENKRAVFSIDWEDCGCSRLLILSLVVEKRDVQ